MNRLVNARGVADERDAIDRSKLALHPDWEPPRHFWRLNTDNLRRGESIVPGITRAIRSVHSIVVDAGNVLLALFLMAFVLCAMIVFHTSDRIIWISRQRVLRRDTLERVGSATKP